MSRDKKTRHRADIIKIFSACRVLVLGDVMMDHFIWGKVSRISPEAPVPVVNVAKETYLLGGAANVLNNIVSLGGKVDICGVIGPDDMGRRLIHELRDRDIETDGMIIENNRVTTVKTRIIAHSQQVVRFDRENRSEPSIETQSMILEFIKKRIKDASVIVISDYAKGVITAGLIKEILDEAKRRDTMVVVDPKVSHLDFYQGVKIITPNNQEASAASGIEIEDEKSLFRAGEVILNRLGCDAVLITRGEQGMTLFERENGRVTHIPTVAQEVYDVTGAGDTVVAVLSLSIAAGAGLCDAANIANHAAGIVVGIVGTATVNPEALIKSLKNSQ